MTRNMSSETFLNSNKSTPKSEKSKNNTLLLLMNGAYEKNMIVDVCDIASILQAVGFKLDKINRTNNNESDNKDANELKITLNCGRSGLQVVYTKHDYVCNCLEDLEVDENDLKNTLPNRLTKRPVNAAKELLASLIKENPENVSNEEIFKTPIGPKIEEPLNQTDWEVDPKTSPPAMTSSPKSETSKSETCSFCLEKDQKIAEIIDEIKKQVMQNAEKILDILPKRNNTFTKKFKRVSDIKPQTPEMGKMDSHEIMSTIKRVSPKKSPRKINLDSPKSKMIQKTITKTPVHEKKNLVSPKRKDFYSPKTGRLAFMNFSPKSPILERRNSIGATPVFRPGLKSQKLYKSPQITHKNPLLSNLRISSPILERRNSIDITPKFPIKDHTRTIKSPQVPIKKSPQTSVRERRNSIGSTPIVRSLQTHLPKPSYRKSPLVSHKSAMDRKSPLIPHKTSTERKSPLNSHKSAMEGKSPLTATVTKEKRNTPIGTSQIGRIGTFVKEGQKSTEKGQNLVKSGIARPAVSSTVSAIKKRGIPTFRKVESKFIK